MGATLVPLGRVMKLLVFVVLFGLSLLLEDVEPTDPTDPPVIALIVALMHSPLTSAKG